MKPLNLSDTDKVGCIVTFDVNRFYLYTAAGTLIGAVYDKAALKQLISVNGVINPRLDSMAVRIYRNT
jgi:hypothetical protein